MVTRASLRPTREQRETSLEDRSGWSEGNVAVQPRDDLETRFPVWLKRPRYWVRDRCCRLPRFAAVACRRGITPSFDRSHGRAEFAQAPRRLRGTGGRMCGECRAEAFDPAWHGNGPPFPIMSAVTQCLAGGFLALSRILLPFEDRHPSRTATIV